MLRGIASRLCSRTHFPSAAVATPSPLQSLSSVQFSSARSSSGSDFTIPSREDMPYLHHKKRPRFKDYVKFKSPQRRASKLLDQLYKESVEKSKAAKPEVFETRFRPGDAIECEIVEYGGVDSANRKRVRGVVIGKYNKGMDTAVLIRDVVMGLCVERRLPLHAPTVKSVKLLEKAFVKMGKKRVRKAKLYYLRDRNPNECRVTKGKS